MPRAVYITASSPVTMNTLPDLSVKLPSFVRAWLVPLEFRQHVTGQFHLQAVHCGARSCLATASSPTCLPMAAPASVDVRK